MKVVGGEVTTEISARQRIRREKILDILADQIQTVEERIEAVDPDPDDLEAQRPQIKWTRTLGYLAGQYRKLMKDPVIISKCCRRMHYSREEYLGERVVSSRFRHCQGKDLLPTPTPHYRQNRKIFDGKYGHRCV